MRLVPVLVAIGIFSTEIIAQRRNNRKNRKNNINWNKRTDKTSDQEKKPISTITDQINERLQEMRLESLKQQAAENAKKSELAAQKAKEQAEAEKHQKNLNSLAKQFQSVNELITEYTPLDLQRKVVQETIQGNITMNVLRESIDIARKHAKEEPDAVFSEEFLDIFERIAEHQIFDMKRRVEIEDAERVLMARSGGQCRNGGVGCTSYRNDKTLNQIT